MEPAHFSIRFQLNPYALLIIFVLFFNYKVSGEDTVITQDNVQIAYVNLNSRGLFLDTTQILTRSQLRSAEAVALINNALRNAHIYSIHLRTAPDIPYNLFYTVLKQINRSENRSLALCTDARKRHVSSLLKKRLIATIRGIAYTYRLSLIINQQ